MASPIEEMRLLEAGEYGRGIERGMTSTAGRIMRQRVGPSLVEASQPQSYGRSRYAEAPRDLDGGAAGSRRQDNPAAQHEPLRRR